MHNSLYKIFHYIDTFDKNYIDKIDNKIILIYRNYEQKTNVGYLKELRDYCKSRGRKIVLSNNFKLAKQLKFDGVYIPSFNKIKFKFVKVRHNFLIIGSAHNVEQIKVKEDQDIQMIFISPLFKTKAKSALGLNKFRNLSLVTNKKILALGGISQKNFKKLQLLNIAGFAAINYIRDKYDFKK